VIHRLRPYYHDVVASYAHDPRVGKDKSWSGGRNSRVLPGLVLESKVISRPKYLSLLDYMTVAIATMTGGPRESVQKLFDYERTYDLDRKVEGVYAI
jgi:hypothetical protein